MEEFDRYYFVESANPYLRVICVDDLKQLMLRVEALRIQLNEAGENVLLTDPVMIEASEKLDALLIEYHRMLKDRLERG